MDYGNGLPMLFSVELFDAGGSADADIVPFAKRALVLVLHRMEADGLHGFAAGAAVKHDVAAFGIEVLPLLTERGTVDEVVV